MLILLISSVISRVVVSLCFKAVSANLESENITINFYCSGFLDYCLHLYSCIYNRIRISDTHGLNKRHGSKFHVGSRVRQTLEEGRRTYQLKCCEYNNKDEDNSPKTLNNKNQQALSHKFRQLIINLLGLLSLIISKTKLIS